MESDKVNFKKEYVNKIVFDCTVIMNSVNMISRHVRGAKYLSPDVEIERLKRSYPSLMSTLRLLAERDFIV